MTTKNGFTSVEMLDLVMGFQKTQILYTATSLGIFDELNNYDLPQTAHQISSILGLDADATERLLNACSALSLLEKHSCDSNSAVYKNSPCAIKFLSDSGSGSIKPLIKKVGDLYAMYGQLKTRIKEGKECLDDNLSNRSEYFDLGNKLFPNQEKQNEFLQVMHMYSCYDAPHVIKAFDLSAFETCVELGGGTGALGLKLAETYPSMEVTVTDLDHVIQNVNHFLPEILPTNLKMRAKDFFTNQLECSDLYVMSHVIHDWNDYLLNTILTKVYDAVNPGGALLVLERVLYVNKDGPLNTLIFDLGMLVSAGGRERTAEEYKQLLLGVGFDKVEIVCLPEAKFRDAILARKKDNNNNFIN